MQERNFLPKDIRFKDRIIPLEDMLPKIEEVKGIIKKAGLNDLIDFQKRIEDDKKPYIQEIIDGLKEEDKNQNILGFFNLENSLMGMAYFLNDNDRSIYLSRLMTDPNFRNKGIASAILEELKMRYDTIKTVPIPLGVDYEKTGNIKRLKRFYTKRGFNDGRQWKRYRN